MTRKISGVVRYIDDHSPASDVLVRAYDIDPVGADFMAETTTRSDGSYSMGYMGGWTRWDFSPDKNWTIWRPDIKLQFLAPLPIESNHYGSPRSRRHISVHWSTEWTDQPLREDIVYSPLIKRPENPDARTVRGQITWRKTGKPARSLTVRAFDCDFNLDMEEIGVTYGGGDLQDGGSPGINVKPGENFGPGEEPMGSSVTDRNGEYRISYQGGHWDDFPHSTPWWRPDIQVRVYTVIDGRTIELARSSMRQDVKHDDGAVVNLSVRDPEDVVAFANARQRIEQRLAEEVIHGSISPSEARQRLAIELQHLNMSNIR